MGYQRNNNKKKAQKKRKRNADRKIEQRTKIDSLRSGLIENYQRLVINGEPRFQAIFRNANDLQHLLLYTVSGSQWPFGQFSWRFVFHLKSDLFCERHAIYAYGSWV